MIPHTLMLYISIDSHKNGIKFPMMRKLYVKWGTQICLRNLPPLKKHPFQISAGLKYHTLLECLLLNQHPSRDLNTYIKGSVVNVPMP